MNSSNLPENKLLSLLTAPNGKVYAGTAFGISGFNGTDWDTPICTSCWISDIDISANGTIWVAWYSLGATGGILEIRPDSNLIWHNDLTPHPTELGRFVAVNGNEIWGAFLNIGAVRYSGNQWTHINKNNSGIPSDTINDIETNINGEVWFATDRGLAKYYNGNWQTYFNGIKSTLVRPIAANEVYAVVNNVLQRFNGSNWSPITGGPSLTNARDIAHDQQGKIWIATSDTGLVVYNKNSNTWQIYHKNNTPGMTSNQGRCLTIDNNSNVWIGFINSGICRLNFNTTSITAPETNVITLKAHFEKDYLRVWATENYHENVELEIYDLMGKKVWSGNILLNGEPVYVGNINQGLYILHFNQPVHNTLKVFKN